jgi:hypothetical protein
MVWGISKGFESFGYALLGAIYEDSPGTLILKETRCGRAEVANGASDDCHPIFERAGNRSDRTDPGLLAGARHGPSLRLG